VTRLRKLLAGAAVAAAVFGGATAAWSYFTAGGSGSVSSAVADLTAPTGVGASANGGAVTVAWTDSLAPDGGAVDGYLVERSDGSSWSPACGTSPDPEVLVDPSGDPTCEDQGVTDGQYTYRVIAVWRSWTAASAPSDSVVVVNDADAPLATIGFPVNSQQYGAASYLAGCGTPTGDLCGTASDASGVALVRVSVLNQTTNLYWNGTAFASAVESFLEADLSSVGATNPTWSLGLSSAGTGGYTVHVQAKDSIGNEQTGASVAAASTFTVDATPPTVTINQAAGQSDPTKTSPVHFTVTFAEPVSGFGADDIALSGTGVTGATVNVTGSSDVYDVEVDDLTDNGSTGTVTAAVLAGAASDAAGNTSAASTSTDDTVTFDVTAPTTTDDVASAWTSSDVTVTLTPSDSGGAGTGVAHTYYTTNGTTPTIASSEGTSFTLTAHGVYPIKYLSVDNAGNAEAVRTAANPVRIDKVGPTGSIQSPTNGSSVGGTITSTTDAADADSGLASVQFQRRPVGGSFANVTATWDTTTVVNGSYELRAILTDNVGNQTTTATVTVIVNNSFTVAASPTTVTAGSSTALAVTARKPDGTTNTDFTGSKSMTITGQSAANGNAPTPGSTNVTFTNGVGTVAVTLYKSGSNTVTVTSGNLSGTSNSVTVNAGAGTKLAWTSVVVTTGTVSNPCLFTCTVTGIGNNNTFVARVSITDLYGNVVTDFGSAQTITVSTPAGGGSFTAPTSGTSVTLAIPASGAATSTASFTFKAQNGNWTSNSFTATASPGSLTAASATVTKQ
jgi:hypothetical protein